MSRQEYQRRYQLVLLVRTYDQVELMQAFDNYCAKHGGWELSVMALANEQEESQWKLRGDYIISAFASEILETRCRARSLPYACVQDYMKHRDAAKGLGEILCNEAHLTIRYLGSDAQLAAIHMDGLKEAYHTIKQPHDYAIMISDGSYASAYEKVQELFAQPLDLLILADALHARAAYQYCQDYHIHIPHQVSMVFFGTKQEAVTFSPLLSGITYRYDIIAARMMREKVSRPRFAYLEGNSIR